MTSSKSKHIQEVYSENYVLERLMKSVETEYEGQLELLASLGISTFEEYKVAVGRLDGLKFVINEAKTLAEKIIKRDDED